MQKLYGSRGVPQHDSYVIKHYNTFSGRTVNMLGTVFVSHCFHVSMTDYFILFTE